MNLRNSKKQNIKQYSPVFNTFFEVVSHRPSFILMLYAPDGSEIPGVGYGYMWWTERSYFKKTDLNIEPGAFSANGTGTQAIYVMPKENMVFVHRVNTDLPAAEFKSVNSNEIGELLKRILSSKEL